MKLELTQAARSIIQAALLFTLTVSPGYSQSPTALVKATVTTGWIFQGAASPLIVAQEKGWFREHGVDAEIVRGFGSADVVAKVAAGTYQAGTGDMVALIKAIAEDPKLDVIAVFVSYDGGPNALTGIRGKAPENVKDIAGKKISAVAGSTAQLLFPAFANAVGIDPASVTFVNVTSALVPLMVQRGEADLATGFLDAAATYFANLGYKQDQVVQFAYSDYFKLFGNGLLVRKSWARQNPEAVRGLVSGYIKGMLYARTHVDEAIDLLLKREPLLKREIERNGLVIANERFFFTKDVMQKGLGYQTDADFRLMIDLLVKNLKLVRTPAVGEVYDSTYLPPATDRVVR